MNSKHFLWLLILIPIIAFMGCEGEVGPAGLDGLAGADGADGADGTDGADGEDGANGNGVTACLECHTDESFLQIEFEYAQSGHDLGEFVGYAGGRDNCAQCHSKQGFLQFATMGEVAADINDPAAIDCATCHIVHPASFAIRWTAGVPLISDDTYTLDFGDDSNLCANCHQTRRAEPNIAAPADTFAITSTHYGPHHGPQANLLEGVGFAEIAGSVAYPAASLHLVVGATCVTCHMGTYEDNEGGHTWAPALSVCNNCHAGEDVNFDHGGFQTDIQAKLNTLRDRLVELGVVEFVIEDDEYEPVVATHSMLEAQAFYNWIGIVEDRSLGVHNPRYIDALLDNTIEALAAP